VAKEAAVGYRRERLDRGIKARADDVFALSSYREMLYLILPRALPIAALLILPLVLYTQLGIYWARVMIICGVTALLALSWDFVASAGMISLGQALFYGLGAYSSGALNHYFGLPIYITIPVATLSGAIIATALLSPVLRVRGIYFAVVTFVLPLILSRIVEATGIFGGIEGLSALAPFPNLWVEAYLVVAMLFLGLFGFRRLINTDYGLVLQGIRDNDRAVMSGGINIYWYKAQALFLGSAVGAFAGAFMTHVYGFAGMSGFALDLSILPVASTIVGGMGSFAGATLGAFLLVPISEALRGMETLRMVFYCFIMVAFIVALPEGIFHYIERKYHQFERLVKVEVK
jgi:branched-chain amino acid transport system permease protein